MLINSNFEAFKAPKLATGMKPGSYCDLISGGRKPSDSSNGGCLGETVVVDADGSISAELGGLAAIAISAASKSD